MNVLILSLYKFNSVNDGYICADLVKEFRDNNHNVTVITPEAAKTETISSEGITHIKIASGAIQKTSALKKILGLRSLDRQSIKTLKRTGGTFDLIICMISHCAFFKTVKFIKRRDGAFVYNMVKDIFPQNAVDMGMMKKEGVLYKWFKRKETKYYDVSDCIGVISQKSAEFLKSDNPALSEKKIEVNPNSCYPSNLTISKAQKERLFEKYALPLDKTIFIYGGNLGVPQGVDFLLRCIKRNETIEDNVFFLVVGNGTEYQKAESFFSENKIANAKLLPRVDAKEFEELCLACDVGLVFLNAKFTVPNYPSRVLSYMQAKLPILFAVDTACDTGVIAEQNGYGYNCISGEEDKFFKHVAALRDNKRLRLEMGEKAYEYLCGNYTVKHSYDIIMKHFGGQNV